MFSSTMRNFGRVAGFRPAIPHRTFATEQQLKARIKSVANIAKITKAMKMVAAAKLRSVQNALDFGRAFSHEISTLQPKEEEGAERSLENHLLVPICSDKGLCGAINSSVVRATRSKIMDEGHSKSRIYSVGEKATTGLERLFKKQIVGAINEYQKNKVVSFPLAASIGTDIISTDFDDATLIYNKFRSMIAYDTTESRLHSKAEYIDKSTLAEEFEFEGEAADTLDALYEFRVACMLYHIILESITAEQSARMNAMENSSKNATEMLGDLQLLYNKTRQTKITTELIEIISGCVSLEDKAD